MSVLGVRIQKQQFSYAVLKKIDEKLEFVNYNTENRVKFPRDCFNSENQNPNKTIPWFSKEIKRIIGEYSIEKIAIKIEEYTGDTKENRFKHYLEGCLYSFDLEVKAYNNKEKYLKDIKKTGLQKYAAQYVRSSSTHWDDPMCEAVVCAIDLLK